MILFMSLARLINLFASFLSFYLSYSLMKQRETEETIALKIVMEKCLKNKMKINNL